MIGLTSPRSSIAAMASNFDARYGFLARRPSRFAISAGDICSSGFSNVGVVIMSFR